MIAKVGIVMLKIKAYAKINLTLDVISKREDGYHEIVSVMQSIDLADILEFEKAKSVFFECDHSKVPVGEENLIIKAFKLIKQRYDLKEGIRVRLHKNIPLAAGLAGGSADAAATIVALDRLFDLKLSDFEKAEIALQVGSDVPFCLIGGTKVTRGRGEKIQDLKDVNLHLLLVKPELEISTREAYEEWDRAGLKTSNFTFSFVEALGKGDIKKAVLSIGNDLERVISRKYKVIEDIKKFLMGKGAISAAMTGSGPTVYGIFETGEELENAYHDLKEIYPFVFVSKTVDKGLEVL
ncbi:MAG: 4-(cytidine 5'-diphospho)-2-C-methyl-D-erythritol kinase [Caldanaerobacter sp.]